MIKRIHHIIHTKVLPIIVAVTTPVLAHASSYGDSGDPSSYLTTFIDYIKGPVGISLITLAIMTVGIGLMFGRFSKTALYCTMGGGMIFYGSAFLVGKIFGV